MKNPVAPYRRTQDIPPQQLAVARLHLLLGNEIRHVPSVLAAVRKEVKQHHGTHSGHDVDAADAGAPRKEVNIAPPATVRSARRER